MAVPKRKVSKSKARIRRASHKTKPLKAGTCSNCGEAQQSHRVCPSCGYYKGRQVVTREAD